MASLPDATKAVSPQSALARVVELSGSALGRIQNRAAQGQLAAVRDWLEAIVAGRAPGVQVGEQAGFAAKAAWVRERGGGGGSDPRVASGGLAMAGCRSASWGVGGDRSADWRAGSGAVGSGWAEGDGSAVGARLGPVGLPVGWGVGDKGAAGSQAGRSDIATSPCQVVFALGCFCRFSLDSADGQKELTGKAALDKKFDELQQRVSEDNRFSLQELEPVHVFGWLLDDEQRQAVDKWTSSMLVERTAAKRITGKRSGAESSDAQAKRAKKREADADVGALFV